MILVSAKKNQQRSFICHVKIVGKLYFLPVFFNLDIWSNFNSKGDTEVLLYRAKSCLARFSIAAVWNESRKASFRDSPEPDLGNSTGW